MADDPRYTSNKKFYSIAGGNRDYVKKWLSEQIQGKRVLDYCCGNGDWALWLAEQGAAEAVGIDMSPVSVENAKREGARRGLSHKVHFYGSSRISGIAQA